MEIDLTFMYELHSDDPSTKILFFESQFRGRTGRVLVAGKDVLERKEFKASFFNLNSHGGSSL